MRLLLVGYTLVTMLWVADLAATPWLAGHEHRGDAGFLAAGVTYRVGALVCHQQSDRSFHLGGVRFPVCARCTGLYAGAPLGALAMCWWLPHGRRRVPLRAVRTALVASALPTAAVWMAEWAARIPVGNTLRALAAVPLGAVVSSVVAAWIARVDFASDTPAGDRAEASGVD